MAIQIVASLIRERFPKDLANIAISYYWSDDVPREFENFAYKFVRDPNFLGGYFGCVGPTGQNYSIGQFVGGWTKQLQLTHESWPVIVLCCIAAGNIDGIESYNQFVLQKKLKFKYELRWPSPRLWDAVARRIIFGETMPLPDLVKHPDYQKEVGDRLVELISPDQLLRFNFTHDQLMKLAIRFDNPKIVPFNKLSLGDIETFKQHGLKARRPAFLRYAVDIKIQEMHYAGWSQKEIRGFVKSSGFEFSDGDAD